MKLSILFLSLLIFFSSNTFACSCRAPDASNLYATSSKIFVGRVIKLELKQNDAGVEYQDVTFQSSQNIKGAETKNFKSYFGDSSCNGSMLDLGKTHIVFLNNNDWTTGYCGGTTRVFAGDDRVIKLIDALNKEALTKT